MLIGIYTVHDVQSATEATVNKTSDTQNRMFNKSMLPLFPKKGLIPCSPFFFFFFFLSYFMLSQTSGDLASMQTSGDLINI